jgi:hypothetical protein
MLSLMKSNILVPMPMVLFGVFCFNGTLQSYFGTGKDFFYHSYVTKKSPDDIVELYQAEDLLKIIAGHPIFFKLFMDKVVVGETPATEKEAMLSVEESRMDVKTLGMEVAFEITDQEEEVEGETMRTFKRYERFTDFFPILNEWGFKVLLWDQTWTYGFRCRPDGTTEIYHHGHDFYGPWPIRLIVQLHQPTSSGHARDSSTVRRSAPRMTTGRRRRKRCSTACPRLPFRLGVRPRSGRTRSLLLKAPGCAS